MLEPVTHGDLPVVLPREPTSRAECRWRRSGLLVRVRPGSSQGLAVLGCTECQPSVTEPDRSTVHRSRPTVRHDPHASCAMSAPAAAGFRPAIGTMTSAPALNQGLRALPAPARPSWRIATSGASAPAEQGAAFNAAHRGEMIPSRRFRPSPGGLRDGRRLDPCQWTRRPEWVHVVLSCTRPVPCWSRVRPGHL